MRYISHEIRTPLNTVFMGIQLARKQLTMSNTDDAQSILHDVEESCVTAVDILNDILLYDKIEDGQMELDKTDISAKDLVKNIADLFMVQVCFNLPTNFGLCMYIYVCQLGSWGRNQL